MSNIISALMSMLPWIYVVPLGNERLKHFTNTTTTDTLSTLHHNVTPLSNEEMFSYHDPLKLSAYLPAANAADTNSIFFTVLLLTGITFGLAIIVYINKRLHLSTVTVMVAAASTSWAATSLMQFMNLLGADVSTDIITFFIFSTMIISLYTFFGFIMMFIYLLGIVVIFITKLLRSTTVNIVVLSSSAASLAAAYLPAANQLIPASSSPRSSSFGYASSLVSSSCL